MDSTINSDASSGAARTQEFMVEAQKVVMNPYSTDSEIMGLLHGYLSSEGFNEQAMTYFTTLMNMRSQRATALSNLEDKKHSTAMSIISNLK